jgi:hypothetical protein
MSGTTVNGPGSPGNPGLELRIPRDARILDIGEVARRELATQTLKAAYAIANKATRKCHTLAATVRFVAGPNERLDRVLLVFSDSITGADVVIEIAPGTSRADIGKQAHEALWNHRYSRGCERWDTAQLPKWWDLK